MQREPLRVMVVDDSVVIRGMISRWVGSEPDMVVAASLRTGLDAVNQIERINPDVAVLDIEMPELDGISALPLLLAGNKGDQAWIDQVIATTAIADRLKHRPAELSGGQQQRVAVARALASRPQIIFADEPTGNLDSRAGTEILHFLRQAVDEMSQTIVMVTHDATAASYADRILFLADGHIVDQMDHPTAADVLERMGKLGE